MLYAEIKLTAEPWNEFRAGFDELLAVQPGI